MCKTDQLQRMNELIEIYHDKKMQHVFIRQNGRLENMKLMIYGL